MPECMAEDGQAAVFVGTFLQNGQSVAVCDEHLVYFAADTLHTMTGVDPAPFIAAISDEQPEEVDPMEPETHPEPEEPLEEPTADPTPPTPISGRSRGGSSDPATANGRKPAATTADAAAATPAG